MSGIKKALECLRLYGCSVEKRFEISVGRHKVIGMAFGDCDSFYLTHCFRENGLMPPVDLRFIIEDFSSDMADYLIALGKIVGKLKERGEVAFGCFHGCGRTTTITLMLLAIILKGDAKMVLKKYAEILETIREPCPEHYGQLRLAAATLLASKKLGMGLENFDVVELGKRMIETILNEEVEVEKIVEEFEKIQKEKIWAE